MEMTDFMAACFFMDGPIIDKICDDFDIDIEEEEFFEVLQVCQQDYKLVGREMLRKLFQKIVEQYNGLLDEEKFEFDVSSPSYPNFYYDCNEIKSKSDLDKLVEKL